MTYDFGAPRLFVRHDLHAGVAIEADKAQANYLANVLRLNSGDGVLLFNGRDGEWRACIAEAGRKTLSLRIEDRVREQTPPPDLHYLFAPLKQARLDYMVQKAVEMGVGRLRPVITRHTQVSRLNLERMEANAIEAAEQCGILSIPAIDPPEKLDRALESWDASRRLIFCDETTGGGSPAEALGRIAPGPLAILIGPEGGFAQDERDLLLSLPYVTAIPLGPRILRADTAAVAALAVVQAFIGDWR